MKYKISIKDKAIKQIAYFKKRDQVSFNKILDLLDEVSRHPFEGIGKPEALKFEPSGFWSRRITREHRMVYKVIKKEVVVISCRYYY